MTEREALKLALEALEEVWYHVGTFQPTEKAIDLYDEARTAIKEVLAQPELTLDGLTPTEFALRELYEFQEATGCDTAAEFKAQPEQEPVAWMHNHIQGNVIAHCPADIDRHPERWTALYPKPKPCPTCEALARTVMLDQTSHDTAPPQRAWVGLTEVEVNEVLGGDIRDEPNGLLEFVRAIEAKLKEKNT